MGIHTTIVDWGSGLFKNTIFIVLYSISFYSWILVLELQVLGNFAIFHSNILCTKIMQCNQK